MTWDVVMVEELLAARASGVRDFGKAWRRAERRARERGYPRPRDWTRRDAEIMPFSAWFHDQCEREWRGQLHADYAALRELLPDGCGAARVRHTSRGERVEVIA